MDGEIEKNARERTREGKKGDILNFII